MDINMVLILVPGGPCWKAVRALGPERSWEVGLE